MSRPSGNYAQLFTPRVLPRWFKEAPEDLKSRSFIRAQADRNFRTRRSDIKRNANGLPLPIELFRAAEPSFNTFVSRAQRWEISRRMGGWSQTEIGHVNRTTLSHWARDPMCDKEVGDFQFAQICAAIQVDHRWADKANQAYAPNWLLPWIEWDKESRSRGWRKTLEQGARSQESVPKILEVVSTQGYRHWQTQALEMMESCPCVGFALLSDPERAALGNVFKAIRRWKSLRPTS